MNVSSRTRSDETLARSLLLRVLSQAFAYPSPAEVARLVEEDLPLALAAAGGLPEAARVELVTFAEALEGETAQGLEERYRDVLGHVHSADCPVCETDYGPRDVWRQTNELADIAGFYRAFGFDPKGERDEPHAIVCRDAALGFLRDHVLRWLPTFAARAEALAGGGPYGAAARLLAAYCRMGSEAAGPPPDALLPGGDGPALEDEPSGLCEDER